MKFYEKYKFPTWPKRVDISELLGQTVTAVELNSDESELYILTETNCYKMYHEQDCCESVCLVDGYEEMTSLIGEPLLQAEFIQKEGETTWGSETWTFYNFATLRGFANLRWHGESNGYYSESVDIVKGAHDEPETD